MGTQKKYIGSKILIVILSLIVMLNGLGLIVAGIRVKNRKWRLFGIGYIVAEFFLSISEIGVYIAAILYFVSIIHTCLICGEYGRLLAIIESGKLGNTNIDFSNDEELSKTSPPIDVKDLILSIGSANIEGEDSDNLSIQIIDEDGKVYRFQSEGNNIVSFQIGSGKIRSYS